MSFARGMAEAKECIMAVDMHNESMMAGSKLIEKSKMVGGPMPKTELKSHSFMLGKRTMELKRGPISGSGS